MAYTPTTWHDGDTITAEKLNKIEAGFASKADKAVPSTAGNIATLDAAGNLVDSGKQPTAAGLGCAPAGYGYGSPITTKIYNQGGTDADFLSTLEAVYGTMTSETCMQVQVLDSNLGTYYVWTGTLYKNYSDYGWLQVTSYNGNTVQRIKSGGTWQPWEWVNPPMAAGVEYRTTERYQGKPVYCKSIDGGIGTNGKSITGCRNTIRWASTLGQYTLPFSAHGADNWWATLKIYSNSVILQGSGVTEDNQPWTVVLWHT